MLITRPGFPPLDTNPNRLWHTVCNGDGQILLVFGSANLAAAQEEARRAERQTGLYCSVQQFRGPRPTRMSVHPRWSREGGWR